jgi:hypothetical protein
MKSEKKTPEEIKKELQDISENKPRVNIHSQEQVDDGNIYYEITGLPTKGKFYPEGTKILARPLKVLEVKKLSQMNKENADEIVNNVISCATKGINIDDLYSSDKLYIIFWLRANTYKNSEGSIKIECPKCNTLADYSFKIEDLIVRDYEEGQIEKITNGLVLANKDVIKFKFLTVRDEQENLKFLRKHKDSLMNFDDEILAICKMIESINGEKTGMVDKYMYLTEQLTPSEFSLIQSYIYDISIGLEPFMEVKCSNCGGIVETPLPFRADFFLPKVATK